MTRYQFGKMLPPKTKGTPAVGMSLRVPPELIGQLDEVAKASGYTRTEVVIHFLRWALKQVDLTQSQGGRALGTPKAVKTTKR